MNVNHGNVSGAASSRRIALIGLRTSVCYAAAGVVWIVFSDRLLTALVSQQRLVNELQTYKGWFFVFATAVLLYLMLRRQLQQLQHEVAARQHAQASLRENEQRLRLALQASETGTWDLDLASRKVICCAQFNEILGAVPPKLKWSGPALLRRVEPEDRAVVVGRFNQAARNHGSLAVECRVHGADGASRWIRIAGGHAHAESGGAGRMMGIIQDITARKHMEHALRENEQRLRLATEAAGIGAFDWDVASGVIDWTPELEAMYGLAPGEFGRTQAAWERLVHPADRAEALAKVEETLLTGQPMVHRWRAVWHDGSVRWIAARFQGFRDAAGQPMRLRGVNIDVTPRVRAEQALRASEAKYRGLFDSIDAGFCIIEVLFDEHDKPVDLRFLEVNSAFERQTGIRDAVGRRMRNIAPAHEQRWFEIYGRVALTGEPARFENEAAQLQRWYEVYAYRHGAANERQVAVLFNDITERRRGDMQLKELAATLEERVQERTRELTAARDAADAASRAKGAFLANMSHEIRTPMNAVLGLAFLLEKRALPSEVAELVRRIRVAGRSLLGVINDILDYSKIESGRLDIDNAPLHLGDVLDNVATVMAATAGDKQLEMVIHPPPPGAQHLCGDALRVEQVLVNLTSNALKFTERGHVEIDVAVASDTGQQLTLRFAVRDTGIGIAAHQQQEIFTPFSQADTSITRRYGGTGLGLAISRRLVVLMGGEMGLRSEPGQGSEFWFTVPFTRATHAPTAAPTLAGLDVLIADDSAVARDAMVRTVEHLGGLAAAVNSGRAALDEMQQRRARGAVPDVIVLDWRMPELDGLATARAIRSAEGSASAPIIIMATAQLREELLPLPDCTLVDAVLNKPVTPSSLYNVVQRALHQRAGLDEAAAGASDGVRLQGLRLLVVDDCDTNREVARQVLGGEGAQVYLAEHGQKALKWLLQHPDEADVVLMDVQMPVMDGYEATRTIRSIPALAHLPVVALTAGVFSSQRQAARAAGMDGFVAKPFDVDAVVALIRQLAGHHAEPAAPAASAPIPVAGDDSPPESSDLPGLAARQGLALWRNPAVYARHLHGFARDYGGVVATLQAATPAAAAALAHKLKGTAGVMALNDVAAAAGELGAALDAGQGVPPALAALQAALETALTSIKRHAPATDESALNVASAGTGAGAQELRALLQRLVRAWDSASAQTIEAALGSLRDVLTQEQLAPLQAAVDGFDFRDGEASSRALARALGVSL